MAFPGCAAPRSSCRTDPLNQKCCPCPDHTSTLSSPGCGLFLVRFPIYRDTQDPLAPCFERHRIPSKPQRRHSEHHRRESEHERGHRDLGGKSSELRQREPKHHRKDSEPGGRQSADERRQLKTGGRQSVSRGRQSASERRQSVSERRQPFNDASEFALLA